MTDIKTRHYGRGQGHPTGWTLAELKIGWHHMDKAHVAICCFGDFIERIEKLEADLATAKRLLREYQELFTKRIEKARLYEREWCASVLDSLKDNEDNKWGGVSVRGAAFRDGAKAIRRK